MRELPIEVTLLGIITEVKIAAHKGKRFYTRHTLGNRNGREAGATREGISANARHTVGNSD